MFVATNFRLSEENTNFSKYLSHLCPDLEHCEEAGGRCCSRAVWLYRGARQETEWGILCARHVSRKQYVVEADWRKESLRCGHPLAPASVEQREVKVKITRSYIYNLLS